MKNNNQKILIADNLGYIGSVMTDILVKEGYGSIGLDSRFFENVIKLEPVPSF